MNQLVGPVVLVLFGFIFFSSSLDSISPLLTYSDEFLVLFVFCVTLFGGKIDRQHFRICLVLIIFWLYVMLNSIFSSYYIGIALTGTDLFLFSKPILLYVGMMNLPINVIKWISKRIQPVAHLYLLIAFAFYFINLAIPVFPDGDRRFGIEAYAFTADNEGEFGNLALIAGLLAYALTKRERKRFNAIALMSLLMLISLRFKAIVLTAIFLLMISLSRSGFFQRKSIQVSGVKKARFTRIRISYILAILPIGLILGYGQFSKYFLEEMTPRLFLLISSVKVANDFFPFGAGAGTFGSAVSRLHYSELYYDLGFSGIWGLSNTDDRFLSDSFWPMIFAQYGFIGAVFVISLYVMVLRNILPRWSSNNLRSVGVAIILLNLTLSTLGSAVLIGSLGTLLIVTLVLLIRET
tara:strand:+ start:6691 stop:7914 length:1224 start_codon:yes stop_codon:yes gene_type:complete